MARFPAASRSVEAARGVGVLVPRRAVRDHGAIFDPVHVRYGNEPSTLLRWRIVSSANAISIGRMQAQRTNSRIVFFSLTCSWCVIVVVVGDTLNSREAFVRASSKQSPFSLFSVGDEGPPGFPV
jgi:hypothetical protein